jgi:hypothetical protein
MSEEGFFSRWSRRKEAVREGKPVQAEAPPADPVLPANADAAPAALPADPTPQRDESPPPTLQDVQSLTPESDFSRFTRPDVAPDVKNAAMKKLFADPHFNTMDRLDVYIDDYGKPDPLPVEMARQLASAQFLKLFEEKEEENTQAAAEGREVADNPAPPTVAESDTDADPDLRLQQDDAPGPRGPGQGTG